MPQSHRLDVKEAFHILSLCFSIAALHLLNIYKSLIAPVLRFLLGRRIPKVLRTPSEAFADLHDFGYNFDANYIHLHAGGGVTLPRVHYVDVGPKDGPVVLCLHGNLSWSFAYRQMIKILASFGYRVLALDFIGFGKSDKYTSIENYSHDLHTMTVRLFIDSLSLNHISVIGQEWGGVIGLSVIKDMPERFSSVVLMDAFLPTGLSYGEPVSAPKTWARHVIWVLSVQLLGQFLPICFLLRKLGHLPLHKTHAYATPFPRPLFNAGAAAWPLMVPIFPDDATVADVCDIRQYLSSMKRPCLLLYSDGNALSFEFRLDVMNLIPSAKVIVLSGAGYCMQETHGEDCGSYVVRFFHGDL